MAWIGALVGGAVSLLSDSGDGGQQQVKKELDPNLQRYIYGSSGSGGLLGYATDLQQQQSKNGGLNGYQRAGLEMQRRTLLDPAYTRLFDQQRAVGAGLLGQGAAVNPFTAGMVGANGAVQTQQPQQLRVPMPQIQSAPMDYGYANTPISQGNAAVEALPDRDALTQWIDDYIKKATPKPAAPEVQLWNGG